MPVLASMVTLSFYLVPSVVASLLLAGVSLALRRLRLPVVAITTLVAGAFGVVWQWYWGVPYGDAEFFYNVFPAVFGDELTVRASYWFNPPSVESPAAWVDRTPWAFQQPQASVIVSGLFWATIGLLIALRLRRRAAG